MSMYYTFIFSKLKMLIAKKLIFLKIFCSDCGYTLELPHRSGSNKYGQWTFWIKMREIIYPCKPHFPIL